MISKSNVKLSYAVPSYVIVWLVCLSSTLTMTIKNISWAYLRNTGMKFDQFRQVSSGFFELMTYVAILFVVMHLYKINDHTMQLAM